MKKGFTLLEIMTVMAIIVILGLFAFFNLQGGKNSNDLSDTTNQVASLLRDAQSDSVAREQGVAWGVYFSNVTATAPFYALFAGGTNSVAPVFETSTMQSRYRLPATVAYVGTFLAVGATTSITFSQISGVASASGSIKLYSVSYPALSSTITVASSGAVRD